MMQVALPANELDVEGEEHLYQMLQRLWLPVLRSEDLGYGPEQVTLFKQDLVIVPLAGSGARLRGPVPAP